MSEQNVTLSEFLYNISTWKGNGTVLYEEPEWHKALKAANKMILPCILILIMLAMGCVIDAKTIWDHLKRPKGVLVGAASQFIILPLAAFGYANVLQLKDTHAIGLMVISCCPGGVASNLFTYWLKGDVALSVCMTSISTALAIGMMPFNLWLYTRGWTQDSAVIPYVKIVISLLVTMVPIFFGVLIKWKFPKVAKMITTLGSVCGLLAILITVVIHMIVYPWALRAVWQVWVVCVTFPVTGFTLGYVFAALLRMEDASRRAVSIETGSQSVPVAVTLITLSYSGQQMADLLVVPILYGIFVMTEAFVIGGAWRMFVSKYTKVASDDTKTENIAI